MIQPHSELPDEDLKLAREESVKTPVLWVPSRCWRSLVEAADGRAEGQWVGDDRRGRQREAMAQAGLLQLEFEDVTRGVFVQCQDVSRQGLGLVSPVPMPVGGHIRFAVRGRDPACLAAFVRGQVVWCEPIKSDASHSMYRVGVCLSVASVGADFNGPGVASA